MQCNKEETQDVLDIFIHSVCQQVLLYNSKLGFAQEWSSKLLLDTPKVGLDLEILLYTTHQYECTPEQKVPGVFDSSYTRYSNAG